MSTTRACLAVLAVSVSLTQAFYLPGAAPRDYSEGEKVDVFVNALTPVIGPQAKLVRHIHSRYTIFKLTPLA